MRVVGGNEGAAMEGNRETIASELRSLLGRENDDAFVIFRDAGSRKFVQFAGSSTEPPLLDLPAQVLSEAEFYRAVVLFRRVGVSGEEYDVFDGPGGSAVGRQFSFMYRPATVDVAADLAVAIFREVFRFPEDFAMIVDAN